MNNSESEILLIYNICIWRWHKDDELQFLKTLPSNEGYVTLPSSWMLLQHGKILSICQHLPHSQTHIPPPLEDKRYKILDGKGLLVIPGLIDSHIHVSYTGESLNFFVNLSHCESISDIQESIKLHMEKFPDLKWIVGVNWEQGHLGGKYPHRMDLDLICSNKPIFLWRACWHIGVANTLALRLAGIDILCHDRVIDGGIIDVDNYGVTGILRERACELIVGIMNCHISDVDKRLFISEGLSMCCKMGLTTVQTNDDTSINVYKALQNEKKLPIRVFLTPNQVELTNNESSNEISIYQPLLTKDAKFDDYDTRLSIQRVKIFSDGSLGAETAAIRGEESDEIKGVLVHTFEKMKKMIQLAHEKKFQLEIHAIGDAAAEQVINALIDSGITAIDRAVITHCQVLGKDLIEKMSDYGFIANIQPSFVPTDMQWVSERISVAKQKYSYVWKTLMKANVHVAGGSDSPIETFSPFVGLYDAIHRRGRGEKSSMIFHEDERLNFTEALWIYTIGGAFAAKCEHILGSVSEGFAADLVFVNPSIVIDSEALRTCKPSLVMVGGNVMYENNNDPCIALANLQGPFVPGKGGKIRNMWRTCSCNCSISG